jgi:hypothetical protein
VTYVAGGSDSFQLKIKSYLKLFLDERSRKAKPMKSNCFKGY